MPIDTLTRLAERDRKRALAFREGRGELYAAIDAAYRDGRTVRELAVLTGLSFQRIHQIVTRPGGPGPRRLRRTETETA